MLLIAAVATVVGALLVRDLYADPDPRTPSAVLPTKPSIPPSKQPGSATVEGTQDATDHPLYDEVRALLQGYFDAINAKDYDMWRETVTDDRAKATPRQDWLVDFRSTQDGSPVIYRIELAGKGAARVLLTFTSTQDRADAPQELPTDCIHWNVVFPIETEGNQWKIASGVATAAPQHDACEGH